MQINLGYFAVYISHFDKKPTKENLIVLGETEKALVKSVYLSVESL